MKLSLISHTHNCDKIISCAAKLCYSNSDISSIIDGLDEEKCEKFISMLIMLGHESPLEHISFTFGIEGVSRIFLSQLTRHRIASYSVQSQRYVKENNFNFIIPPSINFNKKAKEKFVSLLEFSKKTYNEITQILETEYKNNVKNDKNFNIEKKSIEDARYALLGASETKIICTFNARSLLNFFKLRCCGRAQWEIRNVAIKMLTIVNKILPSVFKNAGPPCVRNSCDQGDMSCGIKFKI